MSKSATSSAKLINLMQARVDRLSRQSVLPDERSPGDGEDRSIRELAPAFPAFHQADLDDHDLGEEASNRSQRLQEPQWPLLEMKAAIRDLEYRIVRELRGSQSPGPAAADLEREVYRIGRRLEELNDLVEELRNASHRQSTPGNAPPPFSNTRSLEEIIVDLALRVDSALALEQRNTPFLDSADKARSEAARRHATTKSPFSASILASIEKTADEMRFAQSTWRRNHFQRTCASQNKVDSPTDIVADLLPCEDIASELNRSRAATSVVKQRHGDVGINFEEMLEFPTQNGEREMLGAAYNLPLKAERAEPRNIRQHLDCELSIGHRQEYTQWARPALIEKAQLFLPCAFRSIQIARAFNGIFSKPLKGRSYLAIVGLILATGGYLLFRPGAPVPKASSHESPATSTATKDESGEGSNLRIGQAADGPTESAGSWRGGLQKLPASETKIGNLNAPTQLGLTGGQAPDQAAFSLTRSSPPLQLPSAPERASSIDAGDIQALAEQGDAKAQYELATKLMSGHDAARNSKAAVRWLEKAANQGLGLAQLRLGIIYGKGFGVDRNFALARKWFQAAAENGNALAMHNLAVLLSEGHGHAPDPASADAWFRKAADLGIRDSQYNLGIDYMRGLGVERDLVQAYAWFATAAAQGDGEALKKRKEVRALLDPEELDAAKALANSLMQRQPQAEARD